MKIPAKYLDKTFGVRNKANAEGFNHIIYLAWYCIARLSSGKFDQVDMNGMMYHLDANEDENGLYKPKNSHDNVTYKMVLSQVFKLNKEGSMSFSEAVRSIGAFRIWDVITYGAVFGPKYLRWFFKLFLFIPALQMIHACMKTGKVRPKLWEKRYKWWYKKKKLIGSTKKRTMVIKQWEDYQGKTQFTYHMENDGKHLAIFRLYALKDKFAVFKLTSKICRYIMIKKYGEDYTYECINRYFLDADHPVPPMWKGYGDILK